jgi:hypothetical protein
MRARLLLTFAFAVAAFLQAAHSSAQDAASAKSFLTAVYHHYANEGIGVDAFGPHGSLYFHSSLIALMLEDQKAASPDVGAIDGDPVCACQEWDGIWDLKIDVHIDSNVGTPGHATADVTFALSAPQDRPKDSLRKLSITLAAENGEWRIYDILDQTDPSAPYALRKALQQDIVSHTHH